MWLVLILVIILFTPTVLAQKVYTLKLLAVQENANGTYTGSGADLFLELKEGSGRVFLDTFPVTKMDTQISTRFAKEIACHQFKLPCNKYDFIYTIKASSSIIGGPSAGAAIAALTTIAVLDLDYNNGDTAITGTINSGGIIGPVGGIKEKLEAASGLGLKKVLVAKGTASPPPILGNSSEENATQDSLNLTKFATENLSLQVIEVSDLDEVIFYLTGARLNHKVVEVQENQEYNQIMADLRDLLCKRVDKLESELTKEEIHLNESIIQKVEEQKAKADNATLQGGHYSAASYCFSANIVLRSSYYQEKKPNLPALWNRFLLLEKNVQSLEQTLAQQKIGTISDLQTFIIVKERLNDVKEQIAKFKELQEEKGNDFYSLLSYAEERYFSAQAWMQFFSMEGKSLILDKEHLQHSCLQKISEAEERHQYVGLYIGDANTGEIGKKIAMAKDAAGRNEYELCLMKAIQAKGDANAVLTSIGLRSDAVNDLLDSKITAVKRVIAENSAEGKFPILGYSYYQYATSLQEQEPFTALIYLEYALEMSDLSLYFPEKKTFLEKVPEKISLSNDWWFGFGVGIFITIFITLLLLRKKNKKIKKRPRK